MTDIEKLLEDTEQLCDEATPGPWTSGKYCNTSRPIGWLTGPTRHQPGDYIDYRDAAFIAHARTALPELVAEVKRQMARVAEREKLVGWAPQHVPRNVFESLNRALDFLGRNRAHSFKPGAIERKKGD